MPRKVLEKIRDILFWVAAYEIFPLNWKYKIKDETQTLTIFGKEFTSEIKRIYINL